MTCRSCAKDIPDSSRFCLSCGAVLDGEPLVTQTVAAPVSTPRPARTPSHPSLSSSGSLAEGRFLPGALLANRYRIVALLGRGGMGEVYRAHDLTLGQEVALKFLPEVAARNPAALARFYNEVRIARQVSHPNVCRVYDLGEVEGQPYLSMEYIDGEDLGSLLRRIGRLPSDKAVETARQLCAGLAAAHAKGVLHRDLKPANVMLNGRGQVVVTDFGLAGSGRRNSGRGDPQRNSGLHGARATGRTRSHAFRATSIRWAWCCTKSSPASARLKPPRWPSWCACTAKPHPPARPRW